MVMKNNDFTDIFLTSGYSHSGFSVSVQSPIRMMSTWSSSTPSPGSVSPGAGSSPPPVPVPSSFPSSDPVPSSGSVPSSDPVPSLGSVPSSDPSFDPESSVSPAFISIIQMKCKDWNKVHKLIKKKNEIKKETVLQQTMCNACFLSKL